MKAIGLTSGKLSVDQCVTAGSARDLRRMLACAAIANVAMIAASYVAIPIGAVPVTLQTFALMIICTSFGIGGAVGVSAWFAEACFGAPVTALGYGGLLGLAGGYIVGQALSALICCWAVERGFGRVGSLPVRAVSSGALIVLMELLVFSFGVVWLTAFGMSLRHAVFVGVMPFLIAELVKAAAAAPCIPLARRAVGTAVQPRRLAGAP
ncbi:MAG: biotin transporter BioY [Acetobacteraceae bacterium]